MTTNPVQSPFIHFFRYIRTSTNQAHHSTVDVDNVTQRTAVLGRCQAVAVFEYDVVDGISVHYARDVPRRIFTIHSVQLRGTNTSIYEILQMRCPSSPKA